MSGAPGSASFGRPARIALVAVLVTGTLDLLDAFAFHAPLGISPQRILQSIAGGFLGRAAFDGGMATAWLGGITHFALIGVMFAVFVFVHARNGWVRRHAVLAGLLYGCVLFAVMRFGVLPMSAAAGFLRPMTGAELVNGVFAHTVLVGLPIAWFAQRLASACANPSR